MQILEGQKTLVLTDKDLVQHEGLEPLPIEMLSMHDFMLHTRTPWKEAWYVLYFDPKGICRILKERKPIIKR